MWLVPQSRWRRAASRSLHERLPRAHQAAYYLADPHEHGSGLFLRASRRLELVAGAAHDFRDRVDRFRNRRPQPMVRAGSGSEDAPNSGPSDSIGPAFSRSRSPVWNSAIGGRLRRADFWLELACGISGTVHAPNLSLPLYAA